MSLSLDAIERLFKHLFAVYGEDFDRRLGVTPLRDVKTAWAHQLAGFDNEAGARAIAWAMNNLPERAPNAIEFRTLCRHAPQPAALALPPPTVDPAVAAKAMAAFVRPPAHDPKARYWQLRERELRGGRLTVTQKAMWRAALEREVALLARQETA